MHSSLKSSLLIMAAAAGFGTAAACGSSADVPEAKPMSESASGGEMPAGEGSCGEGGCGGKHEEGKAGDEHEASDGGEGSCGEGACG